VGIDLERETLLTLCQAKRLLPCRRGKGPAPTTVYRWIVRGYRGVRLEALRTPAGWATTAAAVARFLATLAELDRGAARDVPAEADARRRSREWAERVLDEVRRRRGGKPAADP
jgi:hypothetical protein